MRAKCTSKKLLREKTRACFQDFIAPSMEAILRWISQNEKMIAWGVGGLKHVV